MREPRTLPSIAVYLTPGVPHTTTLIEALASPHATIHPIRHNIQMWTETPLTDDATALAHVRQAIQGIRQTTSTPPEVTTIKAKNREHLMRAAYLGIGAFNYDKNTTAHDVLPTLLEAIHFKLIKVDSHVHYMALPRYVYEVVWMNTNTTPRTTLLDMLTEATALYGPPNTPAPRSLPGLHPVTPLLLQDPPYTVALTISTETYDVLQDIQRGISEGHHNTMGLVIEWIVQNSELFKTYVKSYMPKETVQ